MHRQGAFNGAQRFARRRATRASPGTGSPKAHAIEQDDLLKRTFA
ncbi:MAG: hypothetical protein U1F43_04435 [Myxococcota bacterium]